MARTESGTTAAANSKSRKTGWKTPRVQRLVASEAELSLGASPDGGVEQFS